MLRYRQSAGLLMYEGDLESLRVLIVHPGGPIFVDKDEGHWGIPKGEFGGEECAFAAAKREFFEETGLNPVADEFIDLGTIVQKGGKTVYGWAFRGVWEEGRKPISNRFMLEWPPKSGIMHDIPEIDDAMMTTVEVAKTKMRPEQYLFVERLIELLKGNKSLTP